MQLSNLEIDPAALKFTEKLDFQRISMASIRAQQESTPREMN